jgi:hypothetical protein
MLSTAMTLFTIGALSGSALQGIVRASDSAEPIPGVMLEEIDRGRSTWTDSAGRYALRDLSAGVHVLRVSRLGYETHTFEVTIARDSVLHLDIALTPRPLTLAEVKVMESAGRMTSRDDAHDTVTAGELAIGARRYAGSALHANPAFGDPDALQTLALSPDVVIRPEAATTLHVRGGSGDQNLVLLDGVPLYNAIHLAGARSAINPDVVSVVTLNPGVPSARYGGALSSVVSVETSNPDRLHMRSRGAFASGAIGHVVDGPLPRGIGSFVVSGRRSIHTLLSGGTNQTNSIADFGDVFAKGTMQGRLGEIEAFSLYGVDRLAFDAQPGLTDVGGQPIVATGLEPASLASTTAGAPQNGFTWRTATQGVVWRNAGDASIALDARAWRTRFDASADWAATAGPVHLTSQLTDVGVSADASRHLGSSIVTAGVSGQRIHTEYVLRRTSVLQGAAPLLPALVSSPWLAWAFLEDQWRIGGHWSFTLGMRDQLASGQWRDVEPRLAVRLTPISRVALWAGYARTHQYVQSLRNEESLVDAVVGIGLPAAAGHGDVPIARSDELTLGADAILGAGTTLSLGGYTRRLDGLLLVAPATAQPFAMESFTHGSGRASGVTVMLDRSGERVFGHAGYALGLVRRTAGDQQYLPSFASTHAFNMAVGYRPRTGSVLRAALWTTTGRPASVVDGDLQWAPHNLLGGADEMAGTPERIVGTLNGARLGRYARVDLGIRQDWRPAVFGRGADLTGALTLSNALARANTLGAALSSDGRTRRDMLMAPRALTLALEWSY